MAGSIANLSASLRWDLSEFDRGTAGIEGAFGRIRGLLNGMADAVAKFGTRMTAGITLPAGAIAAFSINAASDAKELQSAFDYTFGAMSGRMNKWAEETGDAMGRATSEMQQGALAMGQLFLKAAPTEEAAGRLSQKFTVLAQDVASFYNVSGDEALNSIRAGLVGEAEPLRKFGVFLSAAAVEAKGLELGLVKSGQQLNEYGKIMARSVLIAEALADANGDVERTSTTFANQVRALKSDLQELGESIGNRLLPYAEAFIKWVRDAIAWLKALPEPVKNIATAFAVFLIALGPIILALSTLVVLILPLFIARFGLVGQAIIAFLNPIGTAIVFLLRFATSWSAISGVIQLIGPYLLRLLGPVGLVISAIILFRDKIVLAFSDIWRQASESLGQPLSELFSRLGQIVTGLGAIFTDIAKSGFGDFIRFSIEQIGILIYWLLRLGGQVVISSIEALIGVLTGLAEYISGIVELVQNLIERDWAGAWESATNIVGNAITRIAGWIENLFPALSMMLKMMGQLIGTSSAIGNSGGFAQSSIDNIKSGAYIGGAAGLWGLAVNQALEGKEKISGDYALSGVPKVKRGGGGGRGRSGPSAEELLDRKILLELEQDLEIARERNDYAEAARKEAQIARIRIIDEYGRAGIKGKAAEAAADKHLNALADARAATREKEVLSYERELDLQLAELRGDQRHIMTLRDVEYLERSISYWKRMQKSDSEALLLAQNELTAQKEAEADAAERSAIAVEQSRQIELARIRGDHPDQVRFLEENLRRDDRVAELREMGSSPEDALAQANMEAMDRSRAHMQGTFRDTFRDGLQAALNGNLGSFFENWMKDRTFNALSVVLDRLADSLADLVFGGAGGGGGLLGKLFGAGTSLLGSLGGNTVGSMGAQSVKSLQSTFVPRFNTGGSFRVKGHTGIDKNLLSLNGNPVARVSSGEIMDIRQGNGGASGGGVVEIRLKDDMLDARIISGSVNVVRSAAPQIRDSAVGEVLRRSGRPSL